jgi:subtilisin family serine protease
LFSGDVLGAKRTPPSRTEVVVTMKAPAMAMFGRSLLSASHSAYLARIEAAQTQLIRRVQTAIPNAEVRWRYHLVADGFAVVVPRSDVRLLGRIPGVAKVWPNLRYHALAVTDTGGWVAIGANALWGANLETSGNGMKIGIIDDGLDAAHPFFNPAGFQYPAGFPKGQLKYTTPKVIVQRTFAPANPVWKYANVPFDPLNSFHATHVAGIAAGDYNTDAEGNLISGVAPNAYIGNYKALTIPTPGVGLDGNSAEIAAAIEAAVSDGMNVINLSLGEPEVNPSRDLVDAAINAAAAAGVVPVVAAGNDFDQFGYGSIDSPGNAAGAITVAASTVIRQISSFSSAGPTPVSLQQKPDVTAPGESILSSLPPSQGLWGVLSGTSMATPHVAGAAALLKERHPTWTVEEIKSALVQTGDPAVTSTGQEALASREGGGFVDLVRADVPLLFAEPTSVSFGELRPGASGSATVALTDAGGGAGDWTAAVTSQLGDGQVTVTGPVTVPGTLDLTAAAGATPGDNTGFIVLTRGTDVRRIPYWFTVSAPQLELEKATALTRTGTYTATTVGGATRVSNYRYPTGGDNIYPGPERVFRFVVHGSPANFGVAVLSGRAVPHVVFGADENRLTGYAGLPIDLNPYREQVGESRQIAGAVLPASGVYSIVFDTRSAAAAGPFTFRFWIGDTTPPRLRLVSTRGAVVISATDAGSGVDPQSVRVSVDGRAVRPRWNGVDLTIPATRGRHKIVLSVSDYQEAKNMEDVPPILPNTAQLATTVTVRAP